MSPQTLILIVHLTLAALYLPVLMILLTRRAGQERAAFWLTGYALVAMLLNVEEGLWRSGRLPLASEQVEIDFQVYGALLLAFLLTLTVLSFIRRHQTVWLGVGLFWALGFVAIYLNLFRFGEVIWTNGRFALTLERLAPTWAALGWLVFIAGALLSVRTAHARSRQPLLRNRLNYWTPVFLLVILNDLPLLLGRALPGNPIRLAAVMLGTFIIITHNPPDLREVAQRALTYIITTIVIVGFYVVGFSTSQTALRALPGYNQLLVGAGIALLLSFIFTPLLSLVRRSVSQWLNIQEYHPSRTLHAYSEQISNILDMQKLANIAVGLIIEAMDITRGFLFLIDSEINPNGQKTYLLRAVRNQGERQIKTLKLPNDHSVVRHLTQEGQPLLQYDLDLLPSFRSVSSSEREWFNHLEAEVYLPIFSKREWIGLLALGAKISGNRYSEEDLVTLMALANQTAVALENARLVENLVQLNTELRQAYRDLDKANRNLERLDQTKSDFISIASHELRTPLTSIVGYTDMLIEDITLPHNVHDMLKAISKGTKRLHEIMDSMFDIASINTRTLQLYLVPVDIAALIREVSERLEPSFTERQQTLAINMPALPMVSADPNLLKKLFQHLLTNAIKFSPNGGKISVSGWSRPAHDSEFPNGSVEIVVSDPGVGVDPDSTEIIFSKFYQPGDLNRHSSSKTRFQGSGAGLGLALAKGIVEAHGGRIWVESEGFDEVNFPGSQFHVVLPLTDSNKEDEALMGTELDYQLG